MNLFTLLAMIVGSVLSMVVMALVGRLLAWAIKGELDAQRR